MVEMVDHWIDMIVGYFRWILQNGLSYLTDKAIFFKQLHSQYFIDTVLIYLLVGKLLGNCVQNRTKVSESTLENVMLLESEYTTLKGLIQVLSKKSRNDDETIQSLQTNIEELSSDCEKLKKERKKIQQDSAKILMKCIILDKKVKRYELFYDTYMKGKTNTSDRLRRFSITQ
ncbi:hypothetical protein BC833DRAFT_104718 [Globomyces pollinis-pini]|nr:hypothetical protein BC833DRAFT_104718 [Globomyces pollinis-pini]